MRIILISILICSGCLFAESNDSDEIIYQARIVNSDGKPVGGAQVNIYDVPERNHIPYFAKSAGSVFADTEGVFSFSRNKSDFDQISSSYAIVNAEGYPIQLVDYGLLLKNPKVVLSSQSGSISGQVVDSSGVPIEGARVCAFFRKPFEVLTPDIPELMRFTDSAGKFSFDSFPLKTKVAFYVFKEGYAEKFTFRTDKRSLSSTYSCGRHDIKIVLGKEGSMVGQLVKKETGKPIANEKVTLRRYQGKATLYTHSTGSSEIDVRKTYYPGDIKTMVTDSEGRFAADRLMPGRYTVFHHNFIYGHFSPRLKVMVEGGSQSLALIEHVEGKDVMLECSLDGGKVSDHDIYCSLTREKVAGEVLYTAIGKKSTSGKFDLNGKIHLKALPGRYVLRVSSKTVSMPEKKRFINVPSASYPALNLELNEDGNNAVLGRVNVGKESKQARDANLSLPTDRNNVGNAESKGRFVSHSNQKESKKTVTLSGVCVDENGKPVRDANVYLLTDRDNVVKADSKGRFVLQANMEECKNTVIARFEALKEWADANLSEIEKSNFGFKDFDPKNWSYENTFLIAEDAKNGLGGIRQFYRHSDMTRSLKNIKLSLSSTSQISGRAVDGKGQPIEGAYVEVSFCRDHFEPLYLYKETVTDEKGEFELTEFLMKQNYTVRLTTSAGGFCTKKFSSGYQGCDSADDCFSKNRPGMVDMGDFLLSTKSYSVSGVVVDIYGRPISGGYVILRSPGQGIDREKIFTDEDGKFVFNDLYESEIEISAAFTGHRSYRFKPYAGMEDIRMVLPYEIPEPNRADAPMPSSAVIVSVVDKDSGEPITLPEASIRVIREDGNNFDLEINHQGKCVFFVGEGKCVIELCGVGRRYKSDEMEFTTELFKPYELEYQARPTAKQKVLSTSGHVVYPEVRSKSQPDIWNLKTREGSSDYSKVLEVYVYSRETDMPVADGQVVLSFNKGDGRYIGKTNKNGKVCFAVFTGIDNYLLTSINAPGHKGVSPNKKLYTGYSRVTQRKFKMVQEVRGTNLKVFDLEGNSLSKFKGGLSHSYLWEGRWHRLFGRGKVLDPKNQDGLFQIRWIHENGDKPIVEHFLSSSYMAHAKGFVAQAVKVMPGDDVELQIVPAVEVEGKVVDTKGNGIAKQSFNFCYVVNGATVAGPYAKSREDGSYGPIKLAPGFDYELHITRDRIGKFGELTSFFVEESDSIVQIPDCVFLR